MTTTTLIALLAAASPGQSPPEADIVATSKRSHEFDILLDPKTPKSDIEKVELVWSDDRGQTWHAQQPAVSPNEAKIAFTAKGDGLYYVSTVMFTKSGRRIPPDITVAPPEVKLLIDTVKPVVTLPAARRVGDEVQVEWAIDDAHADDAKTQLVYRRSKSGEAWTLIPPDAYRGRAAKFAPKFAGPIEVRVDAQDHAGNAGGVAQELPGSDAPAAVTTVAYVPPPPPVRPNPTPGPAGPAATGIAPEPTPPPSMSEATLLVAPPSVAPQPVAPLPIAPAVAPQVVPPAATQVAPAVTPQPATLPQLSATPDLAPVGFTPVGAQPVFVAAAPAAPDVKAFNGTHFDVAYDVDGGPSGVKCVDLYVTRDDGRTWRRWSQHAQAERPLKVALDQSFGQRNLSPEGDYGFRLVPTSGAGLSEGAPGPGTPPEFRARVDLTPPLINVYEPRADPSQRNALVLRYKVTDANKAAEPATVEWAERLDGPWVAVTGTPGPGGPSQSGEETLTWVLPEAIAPKVYLRFSASDAAGNKLVTVSNQPFLVDAHRPTARIQGFARTPTQPRR